MKEKLIILTFFSCLALIHLSFSFIIGDVLSQEINSDLSVEINTYFFITISFSLLMLGSFIDSVVIAVLINIFTVIFNVRVKPLKSLLIGSFFNLILAIFPLILATFYNMNNKLTLSVISTNVFSNPLFYIALVLIGLYLYFNEKNLKKLIIVISTISIYKLLMGIILPLLPWL